MSVTRIAANDVIDKVIELTIDKINESISQNNWKEESQTILKLLTDECRIVFEVEEEIKERAVR